MEGLILDIMRESIITLMITAAPMLFTALIVGLVVSIFQTATSIQEQTLTFVPKALSIFSILILLGSWLINMLTTLLYSVLEQFKTFI